MKTITNWRPILLIGLSMVQFGCVGGQVTSPLSTNAGKVRSLKELGYTELGFPEGGLKVGTLVIYDPEKPSTFRVMSSEQSSLVVVKVESAAGPKEWSGARALDVGVSASFLDQAVSDASAKTQSKDQIVFKDIHKDYMTEESIYIARLLTGSAAALETFYASESNEVVGLVREVMRGDIEASSSIDANVGAKANISVADAEVHNHNSADAKVLAQNLVFGFKADSTAVWNIARASGVHMDEISPQIERILADLTRPKYERLNKRKRDIGELPGQDWSKLSFKQRMALARDYAQLMSPSVTRTDKPSEGLAPTTALAPEVKP